MQFVLFTQIARIGWHIGISKSHQNEYLKVGMTFMGDWYLNFLYNYADMI